MSERTPEQITEVIQDLSELWKKHPYLRLGQLVEILASDSIIDVDLFYINDIDIHNRIKRWLKDGQFNA